MPQVHETLWFVARDKQKLGPFSWAELQAQASVGKLSAFDMILQHGADKWVPAGSVPGLFLVASVAPETLSQAPEQAPATVSYREPANPVQVDPSWPKIPGYLILAELGHGAMGVVYKAKHLQLKRFVAIKMVLSGAQASADELVRFRAEAEAVARLQHPNIVQIHEIGDHEGRPFFSLEFVEGGTLGRKLKGDPQPPRLAAELIETLARAMQAAHERGIVHRDLKPGNVLMTKDGVPKVADFGLAKQLDDDQVQTRTGVIMGTPAYMAPEQASGRTRDIGPSSDVYALGVILYEMLTGRPPFKGETTWDTLEQVRTQEPVPPRRLQPKVPRDLETICLKCLAKPSADRYASAKALADDVRRFLDGEPIVARPMGTAERIWRWCRKRPMIAGPTLAAMVALLAFLAYWNTRPGYLDIRVEPKDAEVLLDGTPVRLEEGQALVAGRPGKHEVTIRAVGHLTQEQPVLLIRGRDNAALVNVRLESEFGFFQASTIPTGAALFVYDKKNKLVDQGVTPYNSPRLQNGAYALKFQLGLHEDVDSAVAVPTGDRLTKPAPIAMKPVAGATESQALLAFLKKSRESKWKVRGLDDAVSFDIALEYASEVFKVKCRVSLDSIQRGEMPDPRNTRAPSFPDGEYSPQTFLQHLCGLSGPPRILPAGQIPKGIGYVPVQFSKHEYGFEIVGRQEAIDRKFVVMYPIQDLLPEGGSNDVGWLIHSITQAIDPGVWGGFVGDGGDVQFLPVLRALQVTHRWRIQELVYPHLEDYRLANLKSGVPLTLLPPLRPAPDPDHEAPAKLKGTSSAKPPLLVFPPPKIVIGKKSQVWQFKWEPVVGASKYHLFVKGPRAATPTINNAELQQCSYFGHTPLVPDANRIGWRCKVRAFVQDGWTDWSEERTFDIELANPKTSPSP